MCRILQENETFHCRKNEMDEPFCNLKEINCLDWRVESCIQTSSSKCGWPTAFWIFIDMFVVGFIHKVEPDFQQQYSQSCNSMCRCWQTKLDMKEHHYNYILRNQGDESNESLVLLSEILAINCQSPYT
jgi:hypothetical protein